jgi:thiol reductant ABC exporter CydD subunit
VRPFDPRILRLLPTARRPVLLLGILGVGSGALAIAQAFTIAAVVVAVTDGGDLSRAALALLAVAAGRAVVASAIEAGGARAGVRLSTGLREALLATALRTPTGTPEGSVGDLRTLAVNGATSVEPYVARYLPALISAAVLPVLAITTMAVVDWPSALIVLFTVPLLPVFAALIGRTTAEATDRRWQALRALAGHFLDVVRGLPVLVGYGRASRQVDEIRRVGDKHRVATMATLRLAFLSSAALELLATISVAMVAVSIGLRLSAGHMSLGVGLVAILLAPEAYWPIRRVGAEFHAAADGATAIEDALAMLTPTGGDLSGATQPNDRAGVGQPTGSTRSTGSSVVARGLSYRYPGAERTAVSDIDVIVPAGLTVITGPSGCGKSTLLELLAGLRCPTKGSIQAPNAHLVSQRPFLIPGSIRENLLLPGDRADAQIADALVQVGLGELIDGLPDGVDTVIGDDGFGLSAGQRARLGLARALLTQAPLVLIDEPTAHLDQTATALVHSAIRRLADFRIVIAATHRSGLLGLADREIALPLRAVDCSVDTASSTPVPAPAMVSA